MRLCLLALLLATCAAADPPRRLTNPFVALADDIDRDTEETKRPHDLHGWLYVMLMPWVGLGMFVLSFPILWWNERRATIRRAPVSAPAAPAAAAPAGGSPTVVKGEATNKAEGTDEEATQVPPSEGQSLLHDPSRVYNDAVASFEDRHCSALCCRAIRRCFEAMPELDGYGDYRTYFFRVLGVMLMFSGIDLFLSPSYFLLHSMWFFGFIIAGHLALCACKGACLGSLGTIGVSYIIHRPGVVVALAASVVGVSAVTAYYCTPVHGTAAAR